MVVMLLVVDVMRLRRGRFGFDGAELARCEREIEAS